MVERNEEPSQELPEISQTSGEASSDSSGEDIDPENSIGNLVWTNACSITGKVVKGVQILARIAQSGLRDGAKRNPNRHYRRMNRSLSESSEESDIFVPRQRKYNYLYPQRRQDDRSIYHHSNRSSSRLNRLDGKRSSRNTSPWSRNSGSRRMTRRPRRIRSPMWSTPRDQSSHKSIPGDVINPDSPRAYSNQLPKHNNSALCPITPSAPLIYSTTPGMYSTSCGLLASSCKNRAANLCVQYPNQRIFNNTWKAQGDIYKPNENTQTEVVIEQSSGSVIIKQPSSALSAKNINSTRVQELVNQFHTAIALVDSGTTEQKELLRAAYIAINVQREATTLSARVIPESPRESLRVTYNVLLSGIKAYFVLRSALKDPTLRMTDNTRESWKWAEQRMHTLILKPVLPSTDKGKETDSWCSALENAKQETLSNISKSNINLISIEKPITNSLKSNNDSSLNQVTDSVKPIKDLSSLKDNSVLKLDKDILDKHEKQTKSPELSKPVDIEEISEVEDIEREFDSETGEEINQELSKPSIGTRKPMRNDNSFSFMAGKTPGEISYDEFKRLKEQNKAKEGPIVEPKPCPPEVREATTRLFDISKPLTMKYSFEDKRNISKIIDQDKQEKIEPNKTSDQRDITNLIKDNLDPVKRNNNELQNNKLNFDIKQVQNTSDRPTGITNIFANSKKEISIFDNPKSEESVEENKSKPTGSFLSIFSKSGDQYKANLIKLYNIAENLSAEEVEVKIKESSESILTQFTLLCKKYQVCHMKPYATDPSACKEAEEVIKEYHRREKDNSERVKTVDILVKKESSQISKQTDSLNDLENNTILQDKTTIISDTNNDTANKINNQLTLTKTENQTQSSIPQSSLFSSLSSTINNHEATRRSQQDVNNGNDSTDTSVQITNLKNDSHKLQSIFGKSNTIINSKETSIFNKVDENDSKPTLIFNNINESNDKKSVSLLANIPENNSEKKSIFSSLNNNETKQISIFSKLSENLNSQPTSIFNNKKDQGEKKSTIFNKPVDNVNTSSIFNKANDTNIQKPSSIFNTTTNLTEESRKVSSNESANGISIFNKVANNINTAETNQTNKLFENNDINSNKNTNNVSSLFFGKPSNNENSLTSKTSMLNNSNGGSIFGTATEQKSSLFSNNGNSIFGSSTFKTTSATESSGPKQFSPNLLTTPATMGTIGSINTPATNSMFSNISNGITPGQTTVNNSIQPSAFSNFKSITPSLDQNISTSSSIFGSSNKANQQGSIFTPQTPSNSSVFSSLFGSQPNTENTKSVFSNNNSSLNTGKSLFGGNTQQSTSGSIFGKITTDPNVSSASKPLFFQNNSNTSINSMQSQMTNNVMQNSTSFIGNRSNIALNQVGSSQIPGVSGAVNQSSIFSNHNSSIFNNVNKSGQMHDISQSRWAPNQVSNSTPSVFQNNTGSIFGDISQIQNNNIGVTPTTSIFNSAPHIKDPNITENNNQGQDLRQERQLLKARRRT